MKANEASKESRLLETAYKLFTRKGVKDTSIQEIADNADVGKGTFYLYFKDKYEIRDVLIYRKSKKLFNDAYKESKKQNFSNLTDQIIFIIDSVINKLIKNQVLLKFISKNLSWGVFNDTLKNVYTISNEEDTDGIYDLFLKGINEYKIKVENPKATLFMIIELVSSTCYNSILYEEPEPIDEFKPKLYDTIRKIIDE